MFWAADLHRLILDTLPLSANSLNLYPVFGEIWKNRRLAPPFGLELPQENPRSSTGAVKMFITDTMFTFNGHGDGDA